MRVRVAAAVTLSLWSVSFACAATFGVACSSSSGSGSPPPSGCDGALCIDTGVPADTGASQADTGATNEGDSGAADSGHPDEHDSAAPDALYGACAVTGSFGWSCAASATGADPADCTDPNYPDCFVGGQGSWCTKACIANGDCVAIEDAGCVPSACNMKGYCK